MQVIKSSPAAPASKSAAAPSEPNLEKAVRDETLAALTKAGIIRDEEREGFKKYISTNDISAGDILPVMAQLRGIEEGEQPTAVAGWARSMAPIVKKRYSLIPFAGKLLGSSSFFEKFDAVHKAASIVKCPLIFSEDTDVLGFGTINPVAGLHLSTFVSKYFQEKTGLTPYISMFIIDLTTWESTCRRQFKQ